MPSAESSAKRKPAVDADRAHSKKARKSAALESQQEPSKTVANADALHTLNYLLQRGAYLVMREGDASRYMEEVLSLAKRAVVRLDPSIKRLVCGGCRGMLIDGISCTTSVEGTSRAVHVSHQTSAGAWSSYGGAATAALRSGR